MNPIVVCPSRIWIGPAGAMELQQGAEGSHSVALEWKPIIILQRYAILVETPGIVRMPPAPVQE